MLDDLSARVEPKNVAPCGQNTQNTSESALRRRPTVLRAQTAASANESGEGGHNEGMADLPIACTLSPELLKARRENLLDDLVRRSIEQMELADGFRLRFTADEQILGVIARTVDAERQCCRFLSFTISVSPDGGPITLDLTGPGGTREFLSAMIGAP